MLFLDNGIWWTKTNIRHDGASVTFEAGQKKCDTSIILNLAFIPK
jgi:hypothetical protein